MQNLPKNGPKTPKIIQSIILFYQGLPSSVVVPYTPYKINNLWETH